MPAIEIHAPLYDRLLKLAQANGKSANEVASRAVEAFLDALEFGDTLEPIVLNEQDWALVQKALAEPGDSPVMRKNKRWYQQWKAIGKIPERSDDVEEIDDGAEIGDTLDRVSLNEEDWDLVQKALANPSYNDEMLKSFRIYEEWKATGKVPKRRPVVDEGAENPVPLGEFFDDSEPIVLNEKDWNKVQEALANPVETAGMKKSREAYEEWKATGRLPGKRPK